MKRVLSHSEVSTALDCFLAHSFRYTGTVTNGATLKPKTVVPRLHAGRAWGAAVAAWHGSGMSGHAVAAMGAELTQQAEQMREFGTYNAEEHELMGRTLGEILADYIGHATVLETERPEHEIVVPIPSRGGRRASTRFEYQCFLDGVKPDIAGDWIVEYKLREKLQSLSVIEKSRQLRWMAWAWWRKTGKAVAGVIVDERKYEAPKSLKFNKNGKLSREQNCRPEVYEAHAEADAEVAEKLRAKAWERRHTIIFTEREILEAGEQLVSAAKLIHQLDTGALYPIRNPSPSRCPGCAYKDICVTPEDSELIEALYIRDTPKRLKEAADAVAVC